MFGEFSLINRGFQEMNALTFGHEECPPLHAYGPATRFYYLIHCVISGEGIFKRGGKQYNLHEGQCFVICPDELTYYQASKNNPWHYIWIGFTTSLPLPARLTAPVIESETAVHIFTETLRHMEAGVEQPEIYLTARLWELYSHFTCHERDLAQMHTETLMLRAKNAIESEYMRDITIESLAKRLHLERSYFSTLFKKHFGISPQQYLVDHRLRVAALLLTRDHYTPTLAAHAAGYTDLCNFSRMFRKKYGMSPSKYANAALNASKSAESTEPAESDF